jgi:hypothetical protein
LLALFSTSLSQSIPLGLSLADPPEGLAILDAPIAKVFLPARVLATLPLVPEDCHLQIPALRPQLHLHHHWNLHSCLVKQCQYHRQEELEGNGVHLVEPIQCCRQIKMNVSEFSLKNQN